MTPKFHAFRDGDTKEKGRSKTRSGGDSDCSLDMLSWRSEQNIQ